MAFKSHIAVLAFPFGSHAAPLLALVRRLAASAPNALFSFFNSTASNAALFNAPTCDNLRARDVWDGAPRGEPFMGSHFEAVGLFLEASPRNFETAIREAERESGLEIRCLISDAFLWFSSVVAEKRGVPWVPFWASSSFSLSAHVYTDQIVRSIESTETAKQEKALSFIPGLEMATMADLPPEVFLGNYASPLEITLYKMVEHLPKSTAILLNSFEEINPIITKDLKSKFPNFLNVGPSILASPASPSAAISDETGCLSWLGSQNRPRSVVYISFGSMITPPESELAALCEALETCRFPFLWSIKDHAVRSLPNGFANRTNSFGKMVAWAPQPQILAHESVGAFVSHGGWNSILESIVGCVPMICRPFFGDHKLNSRMVQDSWGIGVRVEGGVFTKSGTIECLMELMTTEKGAKMRENVSLLRNKAVAAVDSQGSSSRNFDKLLEIIGAH
ncbi:flavonol 3-O-glucosyltransferase F3GT2-like [Salvia hispanica]|uniref:flavonol 3-O-glucosyltransferase F3GT2-like n=1 Tax=Salvia hispanica TaxID=49212 RepID=UPI002009BCB1|nr:flavonol 3-O-glucosyltransferase F3GT2-like [Salvia hispanica]